MALTINTNVASVNAQRNINRNSSVLNRSLQRLSSGLRINSAKDDAAGLAISSRFTAQIRGLNQAVRNANDGISLVQTAEGALDETNNILQRMRELAVQAANDSNAQSDRESIQLEINQLVSELDRIADTTTFNNRTLLDGSVSAFNLQVGSNSGDSITFSVGAMRANALGQQPGIVQSTGSRISLANNAADAGTIGIQEGASAAVITAADVTIAIGTGAAVDIADAQYGGDISGTDIARQVATRINNIREAGGLADVYASASTSFTASEVVAADYAGAAVPAAGNHSVGVGSIANGELVINGIDIGPASFQANDAGGDLVSAINAKSDQTGVTASVNANGELVLDAADGRDIVITTADAATTNELFGNSLAAGGFDAAFTGLRISGAVKVSARDTITFAGANTTDAGFATLTEDNVQAVGTIANADVTTVSAAGILMDAVDSALDQVANLRADLGAIQNRLESTISNLANIAENVTAARTGIRDADFAAETAELTKGQILQQAGISVLAQANQLQASVLSLLQ